jgi:hypothetical protein
MYPPPPIPELKGRTTPRQKVVAIAASTAFPPFWSIDLPTALHRWLSAEISVKFRGIFLPEDTIALDATTTDVAMTIRNIVGNALPGESRKVINMVPMHNSNIAINAATNAHGLLP